MGKDIKVISRFHGTEGLEESYFKVLGWWTFERW
jgi:hypothetical protein